MRFELDRTLRVATYILASVGLLILAFDHVLFDKWAIFGASIATLALLAAIAVTGRISLWLGVTAAWIYAAVIEWIRGPAGAGKIGLGLIFVALAFGSASTYTNYRQAQR